jgi:hypothetical protein
MAEKGETTAGQARRASDSRPRPGSGTPATDHANADAAKPSAKASKGDPKPSSSPSALQPGRATKK